MFCARAQGRWGLPQLPLRPGSAAGKGFTGLQVGNPFPVPADGSCFWLAGPRPLPQPIPSPAQGWGWLQGSACSPAVLPGCCRDAAVPQTPASKAGAIPAAAAAAAAVVISQSLDFSSTDIAFPGVAITTGVKSLLTLPCCTNCTISCHCYMPVISFEGLKLLLATSSAPSLPPWA